MNKFKSFVDLGKALSAIVDDTWINHNGVLLEKSGTGYRLQGRYFPSLKAVDDELQRQYGLWDHNIKKQNNGR